MYTVEDIYIAFRQAQSRANERPYKIPKDFDKFLNERLSDQNRERLVLLTKTFNTKWRHIDVDKFFDCGFELFGKNFSYVKFFDRKVLNLYIEKDKNFKRSQRLTSIEIIEGLKFIQSYLKERNLFDIRVSPLLQYCHTKDNGQLAPIRHFLQNKISKYIIVWLISKRYLSLGDEDVILIPLISENYRTYLNEMKESWKSETVEDLIFSWASRLSLLR